MGWKERRRRVPKGGQSSFSDWQAEERRTTKLSLFFSLATCAPYVCVSSPGARTFFV